MTIYLREPVAVETYRGESRVRVVFRLRRLKCRSPYRGESRERTQGFQGCYCGSVRQGSHVPERAGANWLRRVGGWREVAGAEDSALARLSSFRGMERRWRWLARGGCVRELRPPMAEFVREGAVR